MITNNWFIFETVTILRGLRQGCPLSLPLYVMQGEVTTENINNDNNITGLSKPNQKKQVKISQYADNSNFFLQNQKSVTNVINYFQKLKEATGATINFAKTTLLPLNTDIITNLPKEITIKEQYKTVKILEIFYNEDLKQANKLNWEITIDKMARNINKISKRILHSVGKYKL